MSAAPAWLAALGERGGPLVSVAARFLGERFSSSKGDAPRGRDALALLAKALDAHCEIEAPSDEDDRRFVEGAGALLGLVLVDALGGAGHTPTREGGHRVQIGERGFFDPFQAIEDALDDDDPRAALARAIRRAEAESRGEGPSSRVGARFERALEARRPDLGVRERLERYVRLDGGIEVDLGRVIDATRDGDVSAVDQAVAKLVGMLPGGAGSASMPWDEAAPLLVPRLVGSAFVAELSAKEGAAHGLALFPFGHGVHVALLLAYEDRARYLRAAEVASFPRPPDEVLARAIQNLASRSLRARFARIDTDSGPMIVARSGDGLDAARLLLPSLHDVLAPELGSPFVAAIPHRDTLIACAEQPEPLVASLAARARDDAARAPHAITKELFYVAEAGVRART